MLQHDRPSASVHATCSTTHDHSSRERGATRQGGKALPAGERLIGPERCQSCSTNHSLLSPPIIWWMGSDCVSLSDNIMRRHLKNVCEPLACSFPFIQSCYCCRNERKEASKQRKPTSLGGSFLSSPSNLGPKAERKH